MERTLKKDAGNWQKLDTVLDKLLKEIENKREQVNETKDRLPDRMSKVTQTDRGNAF